MTTANNQQDLKNAQSTFNATVPNDAPIQPAQAFVDNISRFVGAWDGSTVALSGAVTEFHLSSAVFNAWRNSLDIPTFDLSGKTLSVASVNEILNSLAHIDAVADGGTLDLSGGTNAAPTGQGLIDKQTLIDAGWTITVNP